MSDSDTDMFLNNIYAQQNRSTSVCVKGPNINATSMNFRNTNMLTSTMSMYGGMSSHRSTYNGRCGSPLSVRTVDSNTSAIDIALALKTTKFSKYDMMIIQKAYNKFIKGRVRKRFEKRRNLRTFIKAYHRRSGGESGDQASDSSLSSDDHRSVRSSRTAIFNDNASHRSTRTNFMDIRKSVKENGMYRDRTDDFRQNHFRNILPVPPRSAVENVQSRLNNTSLMSQNSKFRNGFLLPSQRFNANQSVASLPIPEMPCSGPQRINGQITNRIQNRNQNTFNQNKGYARESRQESESEQEEIFKEKAMVQKGYQTKTPGKRSFEEDDIIAFDRKKNKLSTPVKQLVNANTPKSKQTATKSKDERNSNNFVFAKPQLPVKKPASVKNLNVTLKQVYTGRSISHDTCDTHASKTQSPEIIVTKPHQKVTFTSKSQAPVEEIISQSQPSKETYHSQAKLISKSSHPLAVEQKNQNKPKNNHEKEQHNLTHTTTDVSMRPSFIKRKLFTQKVDEAEKSESSESLQTESPQSIYSNIQREKNKARKLVTQSCLSRDLVDDSNLLDLVYKIVPPDRMNLTAVTNKSEIQGNKSKLARANIDKWDISAIITTNKDEELSDTYTDDEIFRSDETKENHEKNKQNDLKGYNKNNMNNNQPPNNKNSTQKSSNKQSKFNNNNNNNIVLHKSSEKAETNKKTDKADINNRTKNCQKMTSPTVMLSKISPQLENVKNLQSNKEPTSSDSYKKKVYCVKSFWDDSDYETTPPKKPEQKGKGLSNQNAVNDSVSNQVINSLKVAPITQAVSAITNLVAKKPVQSKKKIREKVIQSEEKPVEKLQVNKNVVELQPHKDKNGEVKVQPNEDKNIAIHQPNTPADKHAPNCTTANKPDQNTEIIRPPNKGKTLNKDLKSKQNNTATSKKAYTIPTKVNTNRKEENILKIDNNTLQVRPQRSPKRNKCCTNHKVNDTVTTSDGSRLYRSLRSRDIDLSTSLDKNESTTVNKKNAVKNKQKPVKNKNIKKLSNKENILNTSHQSFTLPSETPLASKQVANKRESKLKNVKQNAPKSRPSDVSFTLGENKLNHNMTTRRRLKEIEMLQLGAPTFFNSRKKSPLSKRVETASKFSSTGLKRSKVY